MKLGMNLVLGLLSFVALEIKSGDLMVSAYDGKNAEQKEAALYIPFIMGLIKPSKLSLNKKLILSQNVYKAFRKQQQKSSMQHEKPLVNSLWKKPYILRF
jgi:hypothetical protein